MDIQTQQPTLVLGATGKTGRRVVERLRARDLPVRAGSRAGLPPFDWEDKSTWAPVLDGVAAVYVSYSPDLAIDGAAETVGALARQAVTAGVERLVLLSGRGEPGAQRGERVVQEAGAAWTIVRCSWFAQNFDEGYAALAHEGVPDDVAGLLGYFFGEVLDGRNAHVTDGVQRALGRPPRDFTEYARAAAATGAWDR